MARDNDYRNTIYCPVLDKVEDGPMSRFSTS